ncbi:MAG: NAD(P)/FAD-dependent oxidoreductase [Clostridia bacterium]|nr:NAD(P)/FAD-dependent oxidoreductase [Clostridia bacterium]
MLTLHNLTLRPHEKERALVKLCERKLRAPVKYFRILKKSLDARDKADIKWVYTVECSDREERKVEAVYEQIKGTMPKVYIAGAGPAGLFCALRLIKHGIRPVIVERGKAVEEREADILAFQRTGVLNPHSNVQFGEGGAGAFSDGKLNTQTNSPLNREVLEGFVRFGAPEEVGYLGKPHVGSDNLKKVVANMRRYITEHGGEVRFSSQLTDFEVKDGKLSAVYINGTREEADALVLAVGHSARDTFELLLRKGIYIEQKEFAVGVRIEHLQSVIGKAQYGASYAALPPAEYKLVSHAAERAVFTFCMCPGGVVIPSASEEGGVVTNGMSYFARDGKNANSALVVQVKKEDFESEHPLAGIAFQRKLEQAAFRAGGCDYKAPVQLVGDFLAGKESYYFGEVHPTHARGTAFAPVEAYLPKLFTESLKAGILDMNGRLSGFAAYDAVLTGVESRTSSPLRILRGENFEAVNFAGIYPCGEGCGYAGGITSAAADGIRIAYAIARKYF